MSISARSTAKADTDSLPSISQNLWRSGSQKSLRDTTRPETSSVRILRQKKLKEGSLVDRDGKRRPPKAPKGYYVDMESVETGKNPVTGYAYRHYTLVKIKKKE